MAEERASDETREEVMRLVGKSCDGTISAEEADRLERLLEEHVELRDVYLAYAHVNAELMWRYRTGKASEERPDISLAREGSQSTGNALKSTRRLLGFLITIAACLLIGLGVFWFGRDSDPPIDAGPDSASGPLIAEQRPTESPAAEAVFVATLFKATSAVWTSDRQAVDVGSRISPGEIWLDSGEAELVFDSGARLVLSGPSKMKLESSLSAYLETGKLAAHMPPSAIGFRVRTPTSELVDRGTEFGVVAESNGQSEVHVFKGQVDVTGRQIELVDGQAMRFERAIGPGEVITYSKARFGGLAQRVAPPIRWAAEDGGNGHFYQLILSDHPISWHQAALDAMNRYHQGMPGHLVTVTSPEEDEFLVNRVIEDVAARGIWIGLTDVLRESHFHWITGEPLEYSNWATTPTQQPDNHREADWHGGEDYGMYTAFLDQQPWAWNDLSVDSIHEKISAYIVEFEPPVDALKHRSMTTEPIQWTKAEGGNDHFYRLVLSLEPVDWEVIRKRASESSFNGAQGHLIVLDTPEETHFVVDHVLRICGIAENVIGLSGSQQDGVSWVNGQAVGDIEVGKPFLPTGDVYGLLRWDHTKNQWGVQTRAMEVLPESWFGYLIEYPQSLPR